MANTGVDLATNAGRVNVPDATEETLSLVLAQTADAEENLPPCSRAMVNTTNANKVMRRRYRQPTRHQRTPETLDTYSSLTGSSILRYKIN